MDYTLLTFLSFSVAAFSIQSAYASSLADKIKNIFGFNSEYKYSNLHYITSWKKIVKNNYVFYGLFPFIIVFIIVGKTHQLLNGLFTCAYCTSFWLMLVVNITLLELTTPIAIALAPLSLVSVAIIEKIME